jgi:tetratricopeptide (TPR) repeat protein
MDTGSRRARRGERARDAGKPMHGGDLALALLLGAVVVGSLLAVGTVHVVSLLVVSCLAIATMALGVGIDVKRSGRVPVSAPVAVLVALVLFTLFQAVPLPIGVLAKIAPANADVWARSLLPFGEAGPRWASISLDPGATLVDALKWLVYACVFVAAAVISSRRGAAVGIGIVFFAAVVGALTTMVHGLLGLTRVFGLYQPHFAVPPWHVGPLLDANNLAGYLNLGAMCGLGLLLMRRPAVRPWLVGLGVATIVGVEVTAASRGGFLALPAGILLFALVLGIRRTGQEDVVSVRAIGMLLGGAVGGGAILALLGATRDTWGALYDKNVEKLAMVAWAKPMVGDHPFWGIGRGAFESVFPVYRTQPGHIVYTHAENFPVQWIAEWGLPVALAALAALAWLFRPRNVGVTRSAMMAGAWTGVAIVLLQNLADLALEVPAVCIAITAVLGSVWGDSGRRGRPVRWLRGRIAVPEGFVKRLPFAIVAAAVPVVAMVALWGRHSVAMDRESFHERATDEAAHDPAARAELRRDLRAAMVAHPAEPYFPLLGAELAWIGRDENPMPWLERTLERARFNGRAHLILADLLAANGAKEQALLELRLAVQDDWTMVSAAARMATRWTRSYEDLMRAVPGDKAGAQMLLSCAQVLPGKADHALRLRLLRDAIARDPSNAPPHAYVANDLLVDLGPGAQSDDCAAERRVACLAELEDHARAISVSHPESSEGDRLRARALEIDGKPEEADRLLADRCSKVADRMNCLLARVNLVLQIKPPRPIDELLKDVTAAGCSSPTECASTSAWVGDILAGRGEWGAAMAHYEKAARENPTENGWLKVANAADRLGAHARAADALERVARLRGGADPDLKRRITVQRANAVGLDKK